MPLNEGDACDNGGLGDGEGYARFIDISRFKYPFDWSVEVPSDARSRPFANGANEAVGLHLPKIDEYTSNRSSKRLSTVLLGDEWKQEEILVARITLKSPIARAQMVTEYFHYDDDVTCTIDGRKLKPPMAVRWEACLTEAPELCSEDGECLSAVVEPGMKLGMLIENNPSKRIGIPCHGGERDFVVHYNLLMKPNRYIDHPVPICSIAPGTAENPQCSPAEHTGP